jgi:hypothetical protein
VPLVVSYLFRAGLASSNLRYRPNFWPLFKHRYCVSATVGVRPRVIEESDPSYIKTAASVWKRVALDVAKPVGACKLKCLGEQGPGAVWVRRDQHLTPVQAGFCAVPAVPRGVRGHD